MQLYLVLGLNTTEKESLPVMNLCTLAKCSDVYLYV